MEKRKNEINMIEGNLFKKILIFSIPLILSGILQLLYNAADLIVCNQFGSGHSTAAISSTYPIINLIVNFFMGLSVGANVLMSRYFGANDEEGGKRVTYTSMVFSLFFGIIVAIFGYFMSKSFLIWTGTPDDVIDLSSTYMKIYFIGVPFTMIYNFGASLLRSIGDTRRPFIFLAISGLINVLLNLLFVIVFNLDVAGVALATIISQLISAILVVICMCRNKGFLTFKFKEIRFYKKEALEIIRIGLPAGVQSSIFSISNILIQSSINSLGTYVMDGSGAANSIEGFIYISMNSISQATVAFVSANYGAKNIKNIKKVILYSAILVVMMNAITGGVTIPLQNVLFKLYVKDPASIAAAKERFMVIATTYFLCGLMDCFASAMRGLNYSFSPTIITLLGVCGIRIIWLFTFFKMETFHNIAGIVLSYPISWCITAVVNLVALLIILKKNKTLQNMQTN